VAILPRREQTKPTLTEESPVSGAGKKKALPEYHR